MEKSLDQINKEIEEVVSIHNETLLLAKDLCLEDNIIKMQKMRLLIKNFCSVLQKSLADYYDLITLRNEIIASERKEL